MPIIYGVGCCSFCIAEQRDRYTVCRKEERHKNRPHVFHDGREKDTRTVPMSFMSFSLMEVNI
mgnify:CR=1 FL=1